MKGEGLCHCRILIRIEKYSYKRNKEINNIKRAFDEVFRDEKYPPTRRRC
jgi:RNase P protein component